MEYLTLTEDRRKAIVLAFLAAAEEDHYRETLNLAAAEAGGSEAEIEGRREVVERAESNVETFRAQATELGIELTAAPAEEPAS